LRRFGDATLPGDAAVDQEQWANRMGFVEEPMVAGFTSMQRGYNPLGNGTERLGCAGSATRRCSAMLQ